MSIINTHSLSIIVLAIAIVINSFHIAKVRNMATTPIIQCWKPTFKDALHTWHPIKCPEGLGVIR